MKKAIQIVEDWLAGCCFYFVVSYNDASRHLVLDSGD